LKNIIRETDSHNTALRAKEAAESRARLRELRKGNGASGSLESSHGRLSREDEPFRKRRRVETEQEARSDRRRENGETHSRRDRDKDSRSHRSHRRNREDRYDSDEDQEDRARHRHRRHHHRSHRQRSEERSLERYKRSTRDHDRPRSSRESNPGSRSPDRKHGTHRHLRRSTSPISGDSEESCPHKAIGNKEKASPKHLRNGSSNAEKPDHSPASDSDPLESIIGPPPPPPAPKIVARGRGTFASSSAMDSHFSSNYDPAADVQPDPDIDEDWDMALEALRDRQKWKTQGAERLKAAGFTEEEVQKWEKGGEKREEDVRWKGRGEGREWDRGKVVGEDGIETVPEWGRLKGT
jgi:hypothetical protein